MPIPVVCPKCRKSFRVSEKFAGKSGPCPNCKAILTVPALAPEVKIHTPEAFAGGGKSVTGKLVTKPVARLDIKIQPLAVALIAAAAVGIVLVAAAEKWDAPGRRLDVDQLPCGNGRPAAGLAGAGAGRLQLPPRR